MKTKKSKQISSWTSQFAGVTFRTPSLLKAALSHPSYRNEFPVRGLLDFDRMEFFGDAILNYVVCRKLFAKYRDADEGLLSRLRSILVSRKVLSRAAKELKMLRYLRLGKSLKAQPLFSKTKILADGFESLVAAIYLDKGLPASERFILKHLARYFDAKKLFRLDPNPKSTLQELCQKEWQKLPVYTAEQVPSGSKTSVTLGKRKATALGRNRQESEEKAARLLILKIRQELLLRSKRKSSGRKLRKISRVLPRDK